MKYIATNQDHDFMKAYTLEKNQGMTYELCKEPELSEEMK